jgi:hypothetical protein
MASDWQQWYKHKIDAWQGSATVQAFTDAGYRAFHNLIMAQFQQPDGKLPEDNNELAKYSRSLCLWTRKRKNLPTIREEVMAHFVSDGSGRVYNRVQFETWEASKALHLAHVDRTLKAAAAKAAKQAQQQKQNDSLWNSLEDQNESLSNTKRDEVDVDVDEDVEGKDNNSCPPASGAQITPAPSPALDANGNPMYIPTVTGEEWPVLPEDCAKWADAFPGVNVLTELLRASVWLEANPRNRKTPAGMRRFIVNWLTRAQNQSRPNGGGNGNFGHGGQQRSDANDEAARRAAASILARLDETPGGSAGRDCQ